MNTSLNSEKTTFIVPVRDRDTLKESVRSVLAPNYFDGVMALIRYDKNNIVDRDKLTFTDAEKLVLDHEYNLQRVRDRIMDLSMKTQGLVAWQVTQETRLKSQLELLLKRDEPSWTNYAFPVTCTGCGEVIPPVVTAACP